MPKDGTNFNDFPALSELKPGAKGFIHAVGNFAANNNAALEERLREVGFDEGLPIEFLHHGPFGRDPLAVQIDGMIVALRRVEAAHVTVALDEALTG